MTDAVHAKILTFFGQYKQKAYPKGSYVKTSDKQPQGVFCLQRGTVRSFALAKKGTELTINMYKPVSFFPVGWAINNTDDSYSYQALTDVEILIAPKDQFEKFLHNNPDVMFDLLKRIYQGLEGYFLRMESLLLANPYLSTVVQLAIATKRFGVQTKAGYNVSVTHAQLASLAELSRETITREIRKLEDKKIVMYKEKKLIVLSLEKLEEELK